VKHLLQRYFKAVWLAVAWSVLQPANVLACSVCYGDPDAPMTKGLTWAIVALVGVIGVVLSGVVAFFVHAARKSSSNLNGAPAESTPDQV
jgi:hypothetical protein